MYSEIENYLREAFERLKQGQFSIKENEEMLSEQIIFLKVGLISLEEYEFWNHKFQDIFSKRIESMTLSTRGRNGLLRANVHTYGKLRRKILNGSSDMGLMMVRNLGEKTVCEIVTEALRCSLISKTELLGAPWTPGHLKKIRAQLKESGL